MKIILSPAKKLRSSSLKGTTPLYVKEASLLRKELSGLSLEEAKKLYKASDAIVLEALSWMEKEEKAGMALFAYSGIAYQYLDPRSLKEDELSYLQDHLRILSGMYGVLSPFDEISFYRLEMGMKGPYFDKASLYEFWGDRPALPLRGEIVLNLASEEYAKAVRPYCDKEKFIDVYFGIETNGKLAEKSVYAKMARGLLTRYCAVNKIDDIDGVKGFHEMGFVYESRLSSKNKLVFVKKKEHEKGKKLHDPDW